MPTIASTNSDAETREERHAGLARDRAREQRLAGARAAGEQHAARDPAAELAVAVGVLEEVDDLGQLLLGLVDAGDVLERDLRLLRPRSARARERPNAPSAFIWPAGGAAREPDEQRDEQDHRAEAEDQVEQEAAALVDRLGLDRDVVVLRAASDSSSVFANVGICGLEVLGRLGVLVGRGLNSFLNSPLTASPVRGDLGHVVRLDLVDEVGLYGIVTDRSRPGAKIATLR